MRTLFDGPVHGVIFDLDGTLVVSDLDFAAIRSEIGIQDSTPILEHLAQREPAEQQQGYEILERHERAAAQGATLNDGAAELLQLLRQHRTSTAIVTRNSLSSVQIVMGRLGIAVNAVVARDHAPPKPSKEPLMLACRMMGLSPQEVIFVGDYVFDRQAGANAGIRTFILCNHRPPTEPDEIGSLHELTAWLTEALTK